MIRAVTTATLICGFAHCLVADEPTISNEQLTRAMEEAGRRARVAEFEGDLVEANRMYSFVLKPTEHYYGKTHWRTKELRRLIADNEWIMARPIEERTVLLTGFWAIKKQSESIEQHDGEAALRWGNRADECFSGKGRALFRLSQVHLANSALKSELGDLDQSYAVAGKGVKLHEEMDTKFTLLHMALVCNQCEVLNRKGEFAHECDLIPPLLRQFADDPMYGGNNEKAALLQKVGNMCRHLGFRKLAVDSYQAALANCSDLSVDMIFNKLRIAEIEFDREFTDEARRYHKEASFAIDGLDEQNPSRAYFCVDAAILGIQNDLAIDERQIGEAIRNIKEAKSPLHDCYIASECEALLHVRHGRLNEARAAIDDAIGRSRKYWHANHPQLIPVYELKARIENRLGNAEAARVAAVNVQKCKERKDAARREVGESIQEVSSLVEKILTEQVTHESN